MGNSPPPSLLRGSDTVVTFNEANRAICATSSGLCLLMPRAAAIRPMTPLRVGCRAVVRRSKRERWPHDCMGPSNNRARQALDDIFLQGLAEGVEVHIGNRHLGFASDSPGLFKLLVVFFEPLNGFRQQTGLGTYRFLIGVDELQRRAGRLEGAKRVGGEGVGVHRV